jgi:hypothetical protein
MPVIGNILPNQGIFDSYGLLTALSVFVTFMVGFIDVI